MEGLDRFAADVATGLSQDLKQVPPVYFYDSAGSQLFEQICELDEYYLTRSEREILEREAATLAAMLPQHGKLVELGSGSSRKTRLLIEAFMEDYRDCEYCPIDISRELLLDSAKQLLEEYPRLSITAVADHYDAALKTLSGSFHVPTLVLWLGSSIGNLERKEAESFLATLRSQMSEEDRFLLGVDLRKEPAVLKAAYNDSQQVTAAFNLNLLQRMNRELGADFKIENFKHQAEYNDLAGRIEMYLESRVKQEVSFPSQTQVTHFEEGERILTEHCYKYSPEELAQLAESAGFKPDASWLDQQEYFSLNLWRPA